jgi:hypothetical protein
MIITRSQLFQQWLNRQVELGFNTFVEINHPTCTHLKKEKSHSHAPQCSHVSYRGRILKKHQIGKTIRVIYRLSKRSAPKC